MSLVNESSLAVTLANLNQALLERRTLSPLQREEAANWIALRAGAPGSYRGLPAPTERDFQTKLRLFTGETVGSRVGTSCKLGFEATWALTVLHPKRTATVAAAERCLRRAIDLFAREKRRPGMYCCYSCSTSGWRVLGTAPAEEGREFLDAALARLRACRDGRGRWVKFPFWYTLLALNDLNQPLVLEELRYAAPALERVVAGRLKSDLYGRRRRLLTTRILERV